MRRALLTLLVMTLLTGLQPARASHTRTVEATILSAAGGQPESTYAVYVCLVEPTHPRCRRSPTKHPQRCLYVTDPGLAQTDSAGRFGFMIELTPEDADGRHRFSLTDATGGLVALDFDVTFYSSLGTCVAVQHPFVLIDRCFPIIGEFPEPCWVTWNQFGHIGPEAGPVYAGMRYALVTLFAGVNGTFRFEIT